MHRWVGPNWTRATEVERLLVTNELSFDDGFLRGILIDYCDRYLQVFSFGCLVDPMAFLRLTGSEAEILEGERPRIEELVQMGMGEYCFSLNAIAAAVHRLLQPEPMSIRDALSVIDHVWEAYVCNETPHDFVPREEEWLCSALRDHGE